ncbi:hypothetical protein D3C78_1358420 [compost metagenome]
MERRFRRHRAGDDRQTVLVIGGAGVTAGSADGDRPGIRPATAVVADPQRDLLFPQHAALPAINADLLRPVTV